MALKRLSGSALALVRGTRVRRASKRAHRRMQVLASALLLAISFHAGAQTPCQTQVAGQTGTLTQSGNFCLVAITSGSEASQLPNDAVFRGFAVDATGDVFFLAGGDAGGNGYNIYRATGSAAQTLIYASPAFASQTDSNPLAQAGSSLGVDVSNGDVSFYGQGETESGIFVIAAGQPQPLATLSSSENGNGFPEATSVLNSGGQLAFWLPIPGFNPSLGCRPFQLAIAQQGGAAPLSLPVATTCGGFLLPAINDKAEVVYAFNAPVNVDGVTQPGQQASVDFYTPLTVSGTNYSVTDSSVLDAALKGYSTSVLALNDSELAAAILSNPGLAPKLVTINFGPMTYPTPTVATLVQAGAVGSGPYGGVLCGTPAINAAGQVLFISGSSGSQGICGTRLYLANQNGTSPQLIIAAGDHFTDLSTGTIWTVSSVAGTSQESLNNDCQVAAYVLATSPANNTPLPFIVRADALAGVCEVQASVPNVVGDTQAAATSALTAAGFVLGSVTTQASTTVPPGRVISQDPGAGTSVDTGTAVNLVISSGVTVPNVVGVSVTAASSELASAGLATGSITQQHSASVPQGAVIAESPAAGSSVAGGTQVNLVISEGVAPVLTEVPNLIDDTQAAATTALTSASLSLGSVGQQASGTVPSGEVLSQSPAAGNSVTVGSSVNVVLSSGPPRVSLVLATPEFASNGSAWITEIGIQNNGNVTANVEVLSVTLNGVSSPAVGSGLLAANLAPGTARVIAVTFPITVTSGVLKLSGTYTTAGTLSGNWNISARVSVPAVP